MQYSLSSRFRGTLVGAVIGEMLELSSSTTTKHFSYPKPTKPDDRIQLSHNRESRLLTTIAGRLAILSAKSLIRLGRFDLDNWRDTCNEDLLLQKFIASSSGDALNCLSPIIISTLPLALFYHENEIKLRQNLELAVTGHDAVRRDGVLAVGYTISQSLNENLNAATLIPQIITFLGEPQTQTAQHLAQVQRLLEQRASLERAVTELSRDLSTPIALAFYCFLSTLEDFRLSVVRAAQTSYQPQVTTAIAAALSGAYNTTSGIPINWRLVSRAPKLAAWGITEAETLQISDSLVAVWSGVYSLATHPTNITQVAVAAPRVIRSR